MKYYLEEASAVLEAQNSSERGLSPSEAERRLEIYGHGRLAQQKKDSLISRFVSQLTDPMVLVLIAAAIISAVTAAISGESYADVFIILAVVILNAILGVVQESKAEAAIEALKSMTAAESTVVRDRSIYRIPADEVVPGDIILLEAGDSVPADGRLIECSSLRADESALTGESVPTEKTAAALRPKKDSEKVKRSRRRLVSGGLSSITEKEGGQEETPLGDRHNMVYMGSSIAYGRGIAVVTETGMNTEMGKIADAISNAGKIMTPLQIKLSSLSKLLTKLVLAICAAMFIFSIIKNYSGEPGESLHSTALLEMFMLAISLAVAAIPEGLAAVVTVVLSLGVTRMSKQGAVVRKLTAVETLGCTQVICSDKTGTLTKNRMTVVEAIGDDTARLAAALALCTNAMLQDGAGESGERAAVGDPTQCAVVNYALSLGLDKDELEERYPRVAELPFDSERKLMTTVHHTSHGRIQYTTGAPDVLISRCTSCVKNGKIIPMTDALKSDALDDNRRLADRALRVIAAGCREYSGGRRDESELSPKIERDLVYLGLVGMQDPIRDEVPPALKSCRSAGIRTVMITGDHPTTASAIAHKLGILDSEDRVMTGAELDTIDDDTLRRSITEYSVYARVKPEHKTRIVSAWRSAGYITAMTGDGVNDAPSLKSADIGIGMGKCGTDVVRNVADLVLADDNFATIAYAVGEGRRIYDNICKAVQFLLSSNLSEVISIFAATVMGFSILSPVQILWINLITDSLPALALGLEKAEPDLMERPPRSSSEGIFDRGSAAEIAFEGALVSALTMAAYFIGGYLESGVFSLCESPDGMTMAFLTMAMAEIFHSCNMRSRRRSIFRLHTKNPVLTAAVIASLALTACVIFIRPVGSVFGFEPISFSRYAISLALAAAIIPIVELVKLLRRIFSRKKAAAEQNNSSRPSLRKEKAG